MNEKIFGENLKRLLKQRGISQIVFAEKIQCSEGAVSLWVRGLRTPKIHIVEKMCEVLNCNLGDLTGDYRASESETSAAYREALECISKLNVEGLNEVINFIGNLNDKFFI